MESNDITPAPQLADVEALFRKWQETHLGGKNDFYRFITTPTVERDTFLADFKIEVRARGHVANIVFRNV